MKKSQTPPEPPPSEPRASISKEDFYQFADGDKILMPKPVAAAVEALLKQGTVIPEIEDCYQIIRDENPDYQHADNSNARKMLTGKIIIKKSEKGKKIVVRRLIPVSAYLRILDVLGIASGKFIQGRQIKLFTTILNASANE
jgi:hypothetical protein